MHIFMLFRSRRVKPALCLFLSAVLVASLMTAIFSVNSGVLSAQTSSGNLNNNEVSPNTNSLSMPNWDTDNLDFGGGSITARSFGVPIFAYSGGHDACVAGAPGFFQTPDSRGDGVNDFPVAGDYTGGVTWNPGNPCAVFASEQDRLADTIEGGVLYHAVFEGGQWTVRQRTAPGWYLNREAALVYGNWAAKGLGSSNVGSCGTTVSAGGYGVRVDYSQSRGSEPFLAGYDTGAGSGSARRLGIPFSIQILGSGGVNLRLQRCAYADVFTPQFLVSADSALCFGGSHPRGEDAALGGYAGFNLVASGSGRTLTSLSTVDRLEMANRFWCRSDVRYDRVFDGTAAESAADLVFDASFGGSQAVTPQTGGFRGWGRMNCYHTALRVDADTVVIADGDPVGSVPGCVYVFPLPAYAAGLTAGELDDWVGMSVLDMLDVAADADSSGGCAPPPDDEPESDEPGVPGVPDSPGVVWEGPCSEVVFGLRENVPAGRVAAPGVDPADSLPSGSGLPGYDLAVTAPHTATASPPQNPAAGDAVGCADGVETRTDHSVSERGASNGGNAPERTAVKFAGVMKFAGVRRR